MKQAEFEDPAVHSEHGKTKTAYRCGKDEFNELYLRTRDKAWVIALSIAKNEEDALDILQDAYLSAWRHMKNLRDPEKFGPWLNSIVANTAKNYLKARNAHAFVPTEEDADLPAWQPETDPAFLPDAALDTAETRHLLQGVIDNLPEEQRLVVLLHYYNDMTLEEISVSTGVPLNTIKGRLRYGRRKVTDEVQALEKRGVRVRGAAPIPLVIWALKLAMAESVPLLPAAIIGGGTAVGGVLAVIGVKKLIAATAAVIIGGTAVGGAILATRPKAEPAGAHAYTYAVTTQEASTLPQSERYTYSVTAAAATGASQITSATGKTAAAVSVPSAVRTESAPASSSPRTQPPQTAPTTARQYTYAVNTSQSTSAQTTVTTAAAAAATSAAASTQTTATLPVPSQTATTTTTATTLTTLRPVTTTTTTAAPATVTPATDFNYIEDNGSIRISYYTGTNPVVVVPATIDGKAVTNINNFAFERTAVTSVTLPASVTGIGNRAFDFCTQLQTVIVSASSMTIGTAVFNGCTALQTVYCRAGSSMESYCSSLGIATAAL
ncbi:MAG: sigma-70 family RNA polymerase sigma factor [Oscillospiraceae bacterium]|nr:sigma-70 family RNA polymerase sigma factor [Oscillospiraceae bacterium]